MNNAIFLIKKDLGKHKVAVVLPGEKIKKTFFLIEITANTSLLEDLKNTYGEQVTALHEKVAKKLFGDAPSDNVYGLLIDEGLNLVFAFNRQFADINKKNGVIEFKDIDDLVSESIKPSTEPVYLPRETSVPRRGSGRGGRGMLIKYSLTEKE